MNGQAVNVVQSVDRTFYFIFGTSAVILFLIALATIYFVIRYNHKRHPVPADFDHNTLAEIIWTAVPTLLVLAMFYYGWQSFRALRGIPEDAMEVKVVGRMWSWSFEYADGRTGPILVVPLGKPVKLAITSKDVIHGFYVPAFRVKIDAVPGMTTYAWLQADRPGDYEIYCTVYCGLEHAKMLSRVHAVSPEEFESWLAQGQGRDGKALLEKHDCLGCHALDGSKLVGPSLKDLPGRQATLVETDGRERQVAIDEAYLKAAIVGDKGGRVKGFEPSMPSYRGQIPPEELQAMVDFLLGRQPGKPLDGAKLAEEQGCLGCHSTDGSILVGPSFKGLFGEKTTVIDQGREVEVLVDADFVKEVLANPGKRPAKGFDPVMPAYPDLTPEQKEALVGYLMSLGHEKHSH